MTTQEVRDILESSGAVRRGHFRLSSGLHSSVYMQCALVLQHPEHSAALCQALADLFVDDRVATVAAPALGGVVFGYELARQLSVRSIFVERNNGREFTLRRGFAIEKGERILVAEDVITTGGSTRETIEVIRALGGEVVGVAALVDRSGGDVDFGVRFEALLAEKVETFAEQACPLCKDGVPVEKPGSRPAAKK
jgi:orotate phosphoribosyltransferase